MKKIDKIKKILNELSASQQFRKEREEAFYKVISPEFEEKILKSIRYLENILSSMFPDYQLDIKYDANEKLVTYSVNIRFILKALPKDNMNRLDYANALSVSGLIFITDNRSKVYKTFKLEPSLSYQYTDNGINVPVLESDSIPKLIAKLVDWFKQNRSKILTTKK